jgi:small-conductance mechanosensitive channel
MDYLRIIELLLPYLPNLVFILLALVAGRVLQKSVTRILRYLYKNFSLPRSYYLTLKLLLRLLIYTFTFLVVVVFIPGVNEQVIALVGIGLGVIVSLSSTSTIGNAVAGLIIYFTRYLHEGDRVDIELLFVHIKTVKDEIVSIPSLSVLNNKIINYSQLDRFIIHLELSLGYDLDPGVIENLLVKAADATDGLLKDPKPFVLITALKDYNVLYEVNAYTDNPGGMIQLKSALRRNILAEFARAGVQIMSPAFVNIKERADFDKIVPRQVSCVLMEQCLSPLEREKLVKSVVEAKKKIEQKKTQEVKVKKDS